MPDSVPFSALPKEPEVLDADAARALVARRNKGFSSAPDLS